MDAHRCSGSIYSQNLQINSAIDEIIVHTKESSATLFAGLDLDIPLDEDDEDSLPGTRRALIFALAWFT